MALEINQLDLFSGIGGFHLGFERAGYKVNSYFSEVDKHAIAVYKQQFKNSTYVGSVTDVRGAELPKIDLITFGSPCQDFSLAGKRKGMGGERSSLILEAIRLISECRPRVFVWENVKGTFSSNDGQDFAAILQEFAGLGGYRLEWQLLNTSWFLPQNRERIYLVGYSTTPGGDWRGVFPIGESRGEISKVRSEYQISNFSNFEFGWRDTAPTLCARDHKDPKIVRVKSATKQGYEIAVEGDSINLSNPNSETRRGRVGKGKAQTLETSCNQAVVQPNYNYEALNETIRQNPDKLKEGEVKALDCYNKTVRDEAPCLTSPEHNTTRIYDGRVQIGVTVNARIAGWHENENVVAAHRDDAKRSTVSEHVYHKTTGQLTTIQTAHTPKIIEPRVGDYRMDEGWRIREKGVTPTITQHCSRDGISNGVKVIDPNYRIRRLTPIECERLQGFPDNHTEYGNYDGEVKKVSNTQRYKQCGNAVTVDVVKAVAEQIKPIYYAE